MVEEKPKPKGANELREKLKRQEIMQNTRKRKMRDGRETRGQIRRCDADDHEFVAHLDRMNHMQLKLLK